MANELFNLWDNQEILTFLEGKDYIKKRELEITECINDRIDYICLCKLIWIQKQEEKNK